MKENSEKKVNKKASTTRRLGENVSNNFAPVTNLSQSKSLNDVQSKQTDIEPPNSQEDIPIIDTTSACLLVKDENHHLNEWIAYHYFLLNLRYLVIAVDPSSQTLPFDTIKRWREPKWNMTIQVWTDDKFTSASGAAGMKPNDGDSNGRLIGKHRKRQNSFYRACAIHIHNQNRTWTTFHDVDEYITVNKKTFASDGNDTAESVMSEQGGMLKLVKKYSNPNATSKSEAEDPFWYEHFQQSPCVTIARNLFGAVESTDDEVNRGVPAPFNTKTSSRRFETLRWRYRSWEPKYQKRSGLAKTIMDISRVDPGHYNSSKTHVTAHRVGNMCPSAWHGYDRLPIGIAHYVGSWESYSYRSDVRRERSQWEPKALIKEGGVDDSVRPWVAGFVKAFGEKESLELLNDIGLPPEYKNPTSKTGVLSSS